jgi:hypothetical protein
MIGIGLLAPEDNAGVALLILGDGPATELEQFRDNPQRTIATDAPDVRRLWGSTEVGHPRGDSTGVRGVLSVSMKKYRAIRA